jgi:hypothetical protein
MHDLGRPRPVLWVGCLVVVALIVLHGTAPAVLVSDMPMDIFVPLDAGWRTYSGQVPHIDFQTPVGRLYYDVYGLMMQWLGADARVVLWVPAVLAPIVGALTLVAATGRVPAVVAVLAAAYLTLMAGSPIHLDRDGLVHLASYNRIGWGLVAVVLLAAAIPRVTRSRRMDALDAILCTVVLVTLFYVKITYFALGGLALILAVLVVPENRLWALIAGVTTWLVVGLTFALSEVPLAYVDDIRAAAASVDPKWAEVGGDHAPGLSKLSADLIDNLFAVILVFGGLAAFSRTADEDPDLEAVANRVGLAGAGIAAAALLVGVQSHDHHNPALMAAALVPVAAFVRRSLDGPRPGRDRNIALALAVGLALVYVPRIGRDAMGIVIHRSLLSSGEGQVVASDDPDSPVSNLYFVAPAGLEGSKLKLVLEGKVEPEIYRELVVAFDGADLGVLLREGQAAILEHAGPDATALTMLFTSPMPVVTGSPPPKNTLSWYHPGRTFGGDNPLVPETLLNDVDVVLKPRTVGTVATGAMADTLEPWLDTNRRKVETPLWTLWIR